MTLQDDTEFDTGTQVLCCPLAEPGALAIFVMQLAPRAAVGESVLPVVDIAGALAQSFNNPQCHSDLPKLRIQVLILSRQVQKPSQRAIQ